MCPWCPWMTPLSDQNLNQHCATPNVFLTQCTEVDPVAFEFLEAIQDKRLC